MCWGLLFGKLWAKMKSCDKKERPAFVVTVLVRRRVFLVSSISKDWPADALLHSDSGVGSPGHAATCAFSVGGPLETSGEASGPSR